MVWGHGRGPQWSHTVDLQNEFVQTKICLKEGTKLKKCRETLARFDNRLLVADFLQVYQIFSAGYLHIFLQVSYFLEVTGQFLIHILAFSSIFT